MNNNLFTGEIGVGLLTLVNLSMLDVSNNRLTGAIPSSSVNSMYGIKLFLDNNSFTGPLPGTLLENANILDLQNNKLSGSIPQFVNTGDMSFFYVEGEQYNRIYSKELCDLSNIRLLDFSENKLNGIIPSCLYNLSFGLGKDDEMTGGSSGRAYGFVPQLQLEFYKSTFLVDEFTLGYETYMTFEIQFAAKQRYDSYTGASEFSEGTLDYMYGLDLSSNELSGVIPAELGDLLKLRALNLSRNLLSSPIPDIESLDLSYVTALIGILVLMCFDCPWRRA